MGPQLNFFSVCWPPVSKLEAERVSECYFYIVFWKFRRTITHPLCQKKAAQKAAQATRAGTTRADIRAACGLLYSLPFYMVKATACIVKTDKNYFPKHLLSNESFRLWIRSTYFSVNRKRMCVIENNKLLYCFISFELG